MEEFLHYLAALNISSKSLKNYKSDMSHFTGWLVLRIRSFGSYIESASEAIPFLNRSLIYEYKAYMKDNSTPAKTINRRLSTLRHFSRHLVTSQILDFDFMEGIENISQSKKLVFSSHPVISEFKGFLEAEKVSPNTIKNYLSDVRQFLTWLETNSQQPTNN